MGAMGDWINIIGGGDAWYGHTNSQIACMFVSHGLLQQFGNTAPTTSELGRGFFGLGMTLTLR